GGGALRIGGGGLDRLFPDRFGDRLGDDLGRGGQADLLLADRDAEEEDEHAQGEDAQKDDDEQGARDLDLAEIFVFHRLCYYLLALIVPEGPGDFQRPREYNVR